MDPPESADPPKSIGLELSSFAGANSEFPFEIGLEGF